MSPGSPVAVVDRFLKGLGLRTDKIVSHDSPEEIHKENSGPAS
jgi:hypothetical protein